MIKVKGVKKAIQNIDKITNQHLEESKSALTQVGFKILEISEPEVPLDEGTLLRSGTVQQVGDKTMAGYNTEYAARLHNHPEYSFQNGRKGNFLSDPVKRNRQALIDLYKQLISKLTRK